MSPFAAATSFGQFLHRLLGNRRDTDRIRVRGEICACFCDARGLTVVLTCTCVDLSPRGMGVYSPKPISPGIEVTLRDPAGGAILRCAQVRYCQRHGHSHRIGFAFSPER